MPVWTWMMRRLFQRQHQRVEEAERSSVAAVEKAQGSVARADRLIRDLRNLPRLHN